MGQNQQAGKIGIIFQILPESFIFECSSTEASVPLRGLNISPDDAHMHLTRVILNEHIQAMLTFISLRVVLVSLVVLLVPVLRAQTDPHITSWVTARSYARVYETASARTAGTAVTTWPNSSLTNGGGGQATAVYSDVQRVVYSTNYVYVYVTGLPSYTTGNWLTPNGMVYTSWPTN